MQNVDGEAGAAQLLLEAGFVGAGWQAGDQVQAGVDAGDRERGRGGAQCFEPRQFPSGAVVMREGQAGDHFHLIVDGSAAVSVRGTPRPSLHRGDGFGEIALLRGIPRTATVTAEQPLATLALGREEFLTAVTGNSMSKEAADALAAQRLAAGANRRDGLPADDLSADPPDHGGCG